MTIGSEEAGKSIFTYKNLTFTTIFSILLFLRSIFAMN